MNKPKNHEWTIEGVTYRKGDRVRADVKWRGGRVTNMSGAFLSIEGDEVFFDSDVGYVAGILSTLEREE